MEITGRLIKILPETGGTSAAGREWKKGGFVIETDETYPKQIAFTAFGEDRIQMVNGLVMNNPVTVTFSIRSREYNERWYTDVECIRVVPFTAQAQPVAPAAQPSNFAGAAPAAPAAPADQPDFASMPNTMPADDNGDLPF